MGRRRLKNTEVCVCVAVNNCVAGLLHVGKTCPKKIFPHNMFLFFLRRNSVLPLFYDTKQQMAFNKKRTDPYCSNFIESWSAPLLFSLILPTQKPLLAFK